MVKDQDWVAQLRGLSKAEAVRRLSETGYNELPAAERRGIWRILLGILREPMFLLLCGGAALYFFLGDLNEALILLVAVCVAIAITLVQEFRTEKAIEALRSLSSPRALVIRDGERFRIPGREVVPGDYVVIAEGDRIPADGILIWGLHVSTDESLLTGESFPVDKHPGEGDEAMSRPGEKEYCLYSATLVTHGQGILLVHSTGAATETGRIGKSIRGTGEERTHLQLETSRIVRVFFLFALVICLIVFTVTGFVRGEWLAGALAGITLAMGLIPEEFPVIMTIFPAIGSWRLSKQHVLVRRTAVIETLGSVTVLCTDKTGTITENRMTVKMLWNTREFLQIDENKIHDLEEPWHELVEYGILASKTDPFDPMEKALGRLGGITLQKTEHLHPDYKLRREYALSKTFLSVSNVWQTAGSGELVVGAKGASETITDLCHIPQEEISLVHAAAGKMAEQGLRVIGVARAVLREGEPMPADQHGFGFQFCGLIGIADPVRSQVPQAIRTAQQAGIRIIMITGDHPVTASVIAAQAGLKDGRVISGKEMNVMDDAALLEALDDATVFARVQPEQKLRIVQLLRQKGEVVAMTGDGVNDAPALRAAHAGIAMGGRGTDVAREASGIVLLDDDFTSIVSGIRSGRRIFDNIRKAMSYVVSVHIPIAGLTLLPLLLGWKEFILLPVHVAFLELLVDPACSIVFETEKEEPGLMERKPRPAKEPLFRRSVLVQSLANGFIMLVAAAFAWYFSAMAGNSFETSRALAFIMIVTSNLALLAASRSYSFRTLFSAFNLPFVLISVAAFLVLFAACNIPFLEEAFHFGTVRPLHALVCTLSGFGLIVFFELLKKILLVKK